jgi:ABC-type transport system substrate-binding protein
MTTYWTRVGHRRAARRTVLGGAAAVAAGTLIGCGDDDAPGPTASLSPQVTAGSGAPTAAPTRATPVDLASLSEEEFFKALPESPPKDWTDNDVMAGGRLVRSFTSGSFTSLDPPATNNSANGETFNAVYSRLVRYSCRQGMKSVVLPEIEADLATSWEQPDPSTLVFKLAPNIRWQNRPPVNGRAFATEDIAYSINRVKAYKGSPHQSTMAIFDTVTALPDGRIQLKLSKPGLSALDQLAQFFAAIVPRELGENVDAARQNAVGTGGMMIKSQALNVDIVFEKNPDFFKTDSVGRKKPYLDGYTLQLFPDRAGATAAFEAKQVDLTYTTLLPTDIDNLFDFYKRHKDVVIQKFPYASVGFTLTPHADKAPWNDDRVRQALTQAIPYEKVIKGLYKGNAIVSPFFPWPYALDRKIAVADLGANYRFDPKAAKALLSAAGFPNGLDFEIAMYNTTEPISVAVQQEIAESGFRAKLSRDPDLAAIAQRRTSKNWKDVITFGRVLPFVNPAATWPVYVTGNSQNYSDFSDARFDSLWDSFNRATTADEQRRIGKDMWTAILARVPDVPLPQGDFLWITQPTVRNMVQASWQAQSGSGMGQMDSVWRRG